MLLEKLLCLELSKGPPLEQDSRAQLAPLEQPNQALLSRDSLLEPTSMWTRIMLYECMTPLFLMSFPWLEDPSPS